MKTSVEIVLLKSLLKVDSNVVGVVETGEVEEGLSKMAVVN